MKQYEDKLLNAIASYVNDYLLAQGTEMDQDHIYEAAESIMNYMQEHVVPDIVHDFVISFGKNIEDEEDME